MDSGMPLHACKVGLNPNQAGIARSGDRRSQNLRHIRGEEVAVFSHEEHEAITTIA
jgi:hypothetical protein